MSESIADLARRLARDAEAVCRHYLSNGRRQGRYWIVGDLDNNAGPQPFVRLHGPEHGKGAAGKWTDAATGEHGDLLDLIARHAPPRHFRDVARRGAALPEPAAARTAARRQAVAGPDGLARSGTATVRHGPADPRHARRDLSPHAAASRYLHESAGAALPSPLLLPADDDAPTRDLAGADRRRHRPRRHDHRRAPHLARSRRRRQGAGRHAAAGHGPAPRKRRPLRRGARRHRRRRRHRDHAVAPLRSAAPADDRGALGQSPRRPRSSRQRFAVSMSRATTIRPATWRQPS